MKREPISVIGSVAPEPALTVAKLAAVSRAICVKDHDRITLGYIQEDERNASEDYEIRRALDIKVVKIDKTFMSLRSNLLVK